MYLFLVYKFTTPHLLWFTKVLSVVWTKLKNFSLDLGYMYYFIIFTFAAQVKVYLISSSCSLNSSLAPNSQPINGPLSCPHITQPCGSSSGPSYYCTWPVWSASTDQMSSGKYTGLSGYRTVDRQGPRSLASQPPAPCPDNMIQARTQTNGFISSPLGLARGSQGFEAK